MALPIVNYEALTPQGDPFARGILPALQQGLQTAYMPQMLQQQLQHQKLANALAQIQAQYAPQMNDSELAQRGASTDLLRQQGQYYGPNVLSEIAQRNAGTNATQEHTKYLPLQMAIELENTKRQNQRFGSTYQMAKLISEMDPAPRQTYIANNQQAYESMLKNLGQAALQEQMGGSGNSDLLQNLQNKYYPNNAQETLNKEDQRKLLASGIAKIGPAQGGSQMPGQMPATLPVTRPGQPLAPLQSNQQAPNEPFAQTPEQSAQLKRALEMSANKHLTTTGTQNQMEGEIQLESQMNDPVFKQQAVSASQYVGAMGKGKEALAALSQQNPKAYEDYLTFKNVRLPFIAGRIKQLEKSGATDEQVKVLRDMYDKTLFAFSSNPEQFVTQLDNLGVAFQSVGESVQKSANPIFNVKRTEGYKPIGSDKSDFKNNPFELERRK